jgi:hypothetical protein
MLLPPLLHTQRVERDARLVGLGVRVRARAKARVWARVRVSGQG